MRLRQPNIYRGVEHEIRNWFRRSRGCRSRAERWAALQARIAAYEQTQYAWVPAHRKRYRGAVVPMGWTMWPRFIA